MIDELHARKLEPCPFCGNREVGIVEFVDGEGDRVFAVGCEGCGCNGTPHIPLMDDARPAAIASWNTRAAVRAAPEGWRLRKDGAGIAVTAPDGIPGGMTVKSKGKSLQERLLYALCDALLAARPQGVK